MCRDYTERGMSRRLSFAMACVGLLVAAALAGTIAPRTASASSGRVSVGGPDVSGYCQHLGFASARFSAPPNQQWECSRPDGSTGPVDLQAACEFSYPQRPIVAEQLTPGVLLTWQCLVPKSAGGGGVEVGGSPAISRLRSALLAALVPRGAGARIRALLRRGSYTMRAGSLAAGSVHVSWSFQPRRTARNRHPKPVTVASGSAIVSTSGTATVKIALTSAGKRMLKRAARISLTATGWFSASAVEAVVASRAFTLTR